MYILSLFPWYIMTFLTSAVCTAPAGIPCDFPAWTAFSPILHFSYLLAATVGVVMSWKKKDNRWLYAGVPFLVAMFLLSVYAVMTG